MSAVMLVERRVVRIDRSPMNPKQWCYQLECGHEVWKTWTGKPLRHKILACEKCKNAASK